MFVLDVSTEMPNLSANADKPITGNVLKVSVNENFSTLVDFVCFGILA